MIDTTGTDRFVAKIFNVKTNHKAATIISVKNMYFILYFFTVYRRSTRKSVLFEAYQWQSSTVEWEWCRPPLEESEKTEGHGSVELLSLNWPF